MEDGELGVTGKRLMYECQSSIPSYTASSAHVACDAVNRLVDVDVEPARVHELVRLRDLACTGAHRHGARDGPMLFARPRTHRPRIAAARIHSATHWTSFCTNTAPT